MRSTNTSQKNFNNDTKKNDSENKPKNYRFNRIAKEFGISAKEAKEIFQPILF